MNNRKLLYACINSIKKNILLEDYEIIVVNNGPINDSVNTLVNDFNKVILINNTKNYGFSKACNIGASNASGELLLFLNNDTIHSKGWIEKLILFLDNDSSVGAIQPKIRNIQNENSFDYAGASGGFIDIYGFPFCRGRIFESIELDTKQYDNPMKIFWASGAALMTYKNLFEELNGFDEDYFAYMEEIDFCWRLQKRGFEVWVDPSSIIYHHGKMTIKKGSIKSNFLNHRNSWILFLKNSDTFKFGARIINRFILDILALVYSIFRLDWSRFLAIIFSFCSVIVNFPKIMIHRKEMLKNQKISMYQGSIAIDYFLFFKRKFSQISFKKFS